MFLVAFSSGLPQRKPVFLFSDNKEEISRVRFRSDSFDSWFTRLPDSLHFFARFVHQPKNLN